MILFWEVAAFAILPLLLRVPFSFLFFFLVVAYFRIMSGERASETHPN